MTPWKARLSLLSLAAFTSTNYSVMKVAVSEISPYSLIVTRFLFAILFLLILQPRIGFPLRSRAWRDGAIPGVLLGAAMLLLAVAVQNTGSGEAAFIVSSDAAFVTLFSLLLYRILPPWPVIFGVILALPGLALLSLTHGFSFRAGTVPGIFSAALFALWLLALDRVIRGNHPFSLSLSQMTTAFLVSVTSAAGLGELQLPSSPLTWFACFYLGAIGTGLRFAVQAFIQRFIDPTDAALIYLFEPVCAAILGFIFLKEFMSSSQLFGCGMILLGIACPQIWNLRKRGPDRSLLSATTQAALPQSSDKETFAKEAP